MLDFTRCRFDDSNTVKEWNKNSALSQLWLRKESTVQIYSGGFNVKIPDSIMRQAKDATLPATVRIGKSGLTDAIIDELGGQLSSRSIVKAKVNRGLYERDDIRKVWSHLADKTASQVIFVRGNVAVFWKN
tara:strand:+ start:254 stop:646 length:393 start_codon:yes stop_codon:yes gene_type:complete